MANKRLRTARPYRRYPRKTASSTYVRKVARIEAKKAINRAAEHKHGETPGMNSFQVDAWGTGASWPCYPTLQGGTDETYVGTSVKPTWITFRGYVEANGDQFNHVRIIVVQWNKGAPVSLTTSDILQYNGNMRTPFSPYDVDMKRKFRVLYDKVYTVINDTGSGRVVSKIHFNIPAKKLRKITYVDGAGNVEQGEIRMYAVSDSTVANHPILQGYGRVYFTDI